MVSATTDMQDKAAKKVELEEEAEELQIELDSSMEGMEMNKVQHREKRTTITITIITTT